MMLMSTRFSGIDPPSLIVEDRRSLEPKASLITPEFEVGADILEEVELEVRAEILDASRTELNPDGVSTSAKLLKLGSPRTKMKCNKRD